MTGGQPRVSVVMPVRNGGRDLDEALASMLGQTFSDFEFIAVDDHSTDETPSRLRRAAEDDPRVRVITSPGQGFVAAVTAGISASGGDWIARMDADDRAHPDRLARQMAYLDAHADVDVLGTSVRVVDADGNPTATIRYPLDHDLIALSLRAATALHHGTVIVRRAALASAGGYRPETFPAEDYDLWCRLVIAGARLANLDEPLYDYRLSASGVSRTVTERQQAMASSVGVEYGRLLPSAPGMQEAWRAAGAIAHQVTNGEVDVRALGRAARSTRESILPWARSRRWDGARAALAGTLRAETAYRRRRLTAAWKS
jgi:cellulose synthase/poly-beta-1,6-N-acetylglucosamine synthase-like glycosyltransferase